MRHQQSPKSPRRNTSRARAHCGAARCLHPPVHIAKPPHNTSRTRLPLVLLLATLFFPPSLQAQTTTPAPLPEPTGDYNLPVDMNQVHFYLLTVDAGDNIWDNFGHTALRVFDENSNIDIVFNWGVFDTSGGLLTFSRDFFIGNMDYRLNISPPEQEFNLYRNQQRTVWQDKLNLNNPQKVRLYRRLMWNTQPENIPYTYQYFTDNCTTRPRDYLDESLGGTLSDYYAHTTELSYRDEIRRHYAPNPLIGFSLDILMNSNIDRHMSEWESMFRPLKLRTTLLTTQSDIIEAGEYLPLLSDTQIIMQFPSRPPAMNPYQLAAILLLTPIIYLFWMLTRPSASALNTRPGITLKYPRLNFRLLGLLGLLTATFSGTYGTLMLSGWFLSTHLDLHQNINLLLFWPSDLIGLAIALYWLLTHKPWPMTHNTRPFINYYLFAHLLGIIAYSIISLADLTQQTTLPIALYIVPGFLLYTLLIWLVGFTQSRPKHLFI